MASPCLTWMAGIVAPAPGERVLEVGRGLGVPVDLLAGRGCSVVARVLAPRGRVVIGFSVMRPGADDDVAAGVERPAAARGLRATAVHRGATAPMPSAAVELRTGGQVTPRG
ncbi:hypothetical protein [Blastococcus sp. TF02A-26]|uniref:hypothetical protein n=1 Tax=Blastococcus sp. TF02A-26 TaxID=2250577 RepID=UPI0013142B8F|nr:hypothetical protein [Blastococcus sp. TF02A-26]